MRPGCWRVRTPAPVKGCVGWRLVEDGIEWCAGGPDAWTARRAVVEPLAWVPVGVGRIAGRCLDCQAFS